MIRRFLKDMWLILHQAFWFNFVEDLAYHSLHQNKNKCQNTVRVEIHVLPGTALLEERDILRNLWAAWSQDISQHLRAGCFTETFATFLRWPKM